MLSISLPPKKKIKTVKKLKTTQNKLLIGWNEWCQLPDLHIPAIKAKVDTGAKTSALHAFNIKAIKIHGVHHVQFNIHPIQKNDEVIVQCKAPIIDERDVISSNGHKEHRYVISTLLRLADQAWEIEITLSNRDPLAFRMLLGREALKNRVIIDPHATCVQGKISNTLLTKLYDTA
ncbi:MAG: hypothetical protein Tsb005_11930 [Gammaproteobacteria bacterium]